MKPREEQIGECRLILGDCLEIMPTLGCVDHIITDPPYEDELHKAIGRIRRNDGKKMVDNLGFDGINAMRAEIARTIVDANGGWAIIFSLAEGVRAWRDDLQAAKAKWDTTLAWIKPDASPRFNGQGASRGFECIITVWCGSGYRHWNGGGRRGVFTYPANPTDRNGQHPTEKPIALIKELVHLFSNVEQTILDPFMGSGTTGIACVQLDRQFIGIERNQKYFDLACRRIERATREAGDIFMPDQKKYKFQDFFGDPKAATQAIEKERVDE